MEQVSYHLERIPAHKYLGLYRSVTTQAGKLWPWHDCDLLCGIVSSFPDSHPIITAHTAGWTWDASGRHYFYGLGVEPDYDGPIPEGFELRGVFPESDYLVFSRPPFDYLVENGAVMSSVEDMAWHFDPSSTGYAWNEDVCQDYQRHYPEGLGYQVLRPVKKL